MGLPFPAGKHLESLALQTTEYEPLPSSMKDGWISFAGPCSAAIRRINETMSDMDKSNLARAVEVYKRQELGGTTGDTYGFVVEVTEVLLILVYLIILSILSATVVANPTMF